MKDMQPQNIEFLSSSQAMCSTIATFNCFKVRFPTIVFILVILIIHYSLANWKTTNRNVCCNVNV